MRQSLDELHQQLLARGSALIELSGKPEQVLQLLREKIPFDFVYYEQIQAPEEMAQVDAIKAYGLEIRSFWQSSMIDPQDLPFTLPEMPDVFTKFRQEIERHGLKFAKPIAAPEHIPPLLSTNIMVNPVSHTIPGKFVSS